MELGDTSDKEASPPQARKRKMSKSRQIQMVLMLQMLEMDDGMRKGAFTIVTKSFGMASLTVHCLWNRVVCTHATGHIISPEFHSCKKIAGDGLCICLRSSMRESRISHCGKGILKESWRSRWGCQRQQCIVGLLIGPYMCILTH